MANFLVSVSFPTLLVLMGPLLCFLYGALGVAAFIFIARYVPETKGQSLEEISLHWRTKRLGILVRH